MSVKNVLLEEVVNINIGRTPSRGTVRYWGTGEPWVSIRDLNNLENNKYISETKESITPIAIKETNMRKVPKGTVLFSFKLSIGKVAITSRPVFTNEAIASFSIKNPNVLSADFLFYVLKKVDFQRQADYAVMGKTLNKKKLALLSIPLPDLQTQNKIVAVLDKASHLIQKREASIKLMNELLRAQFLETFGDPMFNPNQWQIKRLEDVCEFITKGTTPKAVEIRKAQFPDSIPYLKVYNITDDGIIDFDYNPSYISNTIHNNKLKRSKVYPNDILMNIVGPPLGKIGIVSSQFSEWNVNQAIAIFRVKKGILPSYLLSALRSQNLLHSIIRKAVGVRQLNLSLQQCRNIEIPIPPIELQKYFDEIIKRIKKQRFELVKTKNELQNLFDSILQKAFKGELEFNANAETDIELDALIAAIDILEKNDLTNISSDKVYLQRLVDRVNGEQFKNGGQYQKIKYAIFQLLKEGKIKQDYDSNNENVKLKLT